MHITTTNIRGVTGNATVELNGITALCGPVGAGKSSIMLAVAACLTGKPLPGQTGQKATADLMAMISHGQQDARAKLVKDDGASTIIAYPSGSVLSSSPTPTASPTACGLVSILDMRPADRADALANALKSLPTEADLATALEVAGVPMAIANAVQADVAKFTWESLCDIWKKNGQKAKGTWESITRANYGLKLAVEWRPDGWEPDLSACLRPDLERDVSLATDKLAKAQRAIGADEAKISELSNKVSQLEDLSLIHI